MTAGKTARTALVAEGISKRYGATIANDDVDLALVGGEVHALLGQNGAGKSTLVGVLTGRVLPDAGRALLDGRELPFGNPRASAAAGVATVFQDLMLVPSMTGLENIALALGVSATRATRRQVLDVQQEFQLPAKLDAPIADLELPERQRVELLRALCQKPAILLLDEPTSLLRPTAIPGFLAKVKELAEGGLAVLLITHRLDEARRIADRVTVMRRGSVVASYSGGELPSNSDLAVAMLGTAVVERLEAATPSDRVVLEAAGLDVFDDHKHPAVSSLSLTVGEGEILGLAGVDGNGQLELLEALAGLRRAASGRIVYDADDVTKSSYEQRSRRGIHFVSGDRRRYGIVPTFLVSEHFEYALGRSPISAVHRALRNYGVSPPNPGHRADQLSGGNQQKMILARAGERRPRVLLLSYPTVGLDVQASLNVRELLLEQARQGTAIVVASSDLDELLSICHRVGVMNRGRIVGMQERGRFDRRQLAEWFTTSELVDAGAVA